MRRLRSLGRKERVLKPLTGGPKDARFSRIMKEILAASLFLLLLSYSFGPVSYASTSVVATVAVGKGPWGVAYDSGKGEVFVANSNGNSVSVISDASNAVVATVTGSEDRRGGEYDSGKGAVFVYDA